jgi:hypothetical protein
LVYLRFDGFSVGLLGTGFFIGKYETTKYQWSFHVQLEMALLQSTIKCIPVMSRKLLTRNPRKTALLTRFGIESRRYRTMQ